MKADSLFFLHLKGFERKDGGFVTQSKNNRNFTVK